MLVQTPTIKSGLPRGVTPGASQVTLGAPPAGFMTGAPPLGAPPLGAPPPATPPAEVPADGIGSLTLDPAAEGWPPVPPVSLLPPAAAAEPCPVPQPSTRHVAQP